MMLWNRAGPPVEVRYHCIQLYSYKRHYQFEWYIHRCSSTVCMWIFKCLVRSAALNSKPRPHWIQYSQMDIYISNASSRYYRNMSLRPYSWSIHMACLVRSLSAHYWIILFISQVPVAIIFFSFLYHQGLNALHLSDPQPELETV